ncbi:MAG TPA: putative lipid II flippase FtsW [Actinomycetota bacterium]|nr:putative lipid II flippase FtsW [Actinomycetota bacterium]
MADRTVARRGPTAARHLRLVSTAELLRSPRSGSAIARRNLTLLLVPTAVLTIVGLVMILSAGSISAVEGYGTSFWYFNRQAVYALAGVIGLVLTARLPIAFWRRAAIPLLLLLVPLMLLALHPSVGSSLYGASRWIDLGPITLQPAEFAKLLTICSAAAILSRPWKDLRKPRDALLPLAPLVLAVAGVIMLQRDLGTALIVCGSAFLLLFAAGVPFRTLLWTGLAGLAGLAYSIFGTAYRRTRFLEAWLNWELDPSGAGWQLRQGLIALGSGGWFGVGLGNSRQKWDYLPNAHSDFVFAVLGEELGLVGAFAVLSLFGVLLYAGIRIAMNATDPFARLLAAGITGWLGLQTLVNLGAVTGLLPITGVPLPFVSFGGTALVVTLAAVGVLASVALEPVRAGERRRPLGRSRPAARRSGR